MLGDDIGLSSLLSACLVRIIEFLHVAELLASFLDSRLVELSEGRMCGIDMSPNAQRVGGVLHGGVIIALLDRTMGFAALTLNDCADQVMAELKINSWSQACRGSSKFAVRW